MIGLFWLLWYCIIVLIDPIGFNRIQVVTLGLTAIEIYGCLVGSLGVPLGVSTMDALATNKRLYITKRLERPWLIIGAASIGLVKMSVVCLYRRTFVGAIFQRLSLIWIILLAVWIISFMIGGIFTCGTHQSAFTGTPEQYYQYCGFGPRLATAYYASDVATDAVTLLMPLPLVSTYKYHPVQGTYGDRSGDYR